MRSTLLEGGPLASPVRIALGRGRAFAVSCVALQPHYQKRDISEALEAPVLSGQPGSTAMTPTSAKCQQELRVIPV